MQNAQHFTEAELDANGPIFPTGTVRYFYQDGADFYMAARREVATGEDAWREDDEPITICTYPHKVKDWDNAGAVAARAWFLREWCPRNNVNPVFVG